MNKAAFMLGFTMAIFLCVSRANATDTAGSQEETARKFRQYLQDDWKQWMEEYPEMATQVGYPGQNRRWTDPSPEGYAAHEKHLRASLKTLLNIRRQDLPASEQLNYDLYR